MLKLSLVDGKVSVEPQTLEYSINAWDPEQLYGPDGLQAFYKENASTRPVTPSSQQSQSPRRPLNPGAVFPTSPLQ